MQLSENYFLDEILNQALLQSTSEHMNAHTLVTSILCVTDATGYSLPQWPK